MNVLSTVILGEMLVMRLNKDIQTSVPSFQQAFNESAGTLNTFLDTTTHLIYSIIQFVVAAILFFLLLRLIIWMSREDERIIISPFDIQTYNKAYNGKIISDSLILEIYRITKIHNINYEDISPENIILPKVTPIGESLETKISTLGGFSVGGVDIPGGELVLVLKQLWSVGGPGKRITGSLQEHESEIRLTAQMGGHETFSWDTEREKTQTHSKDQIVSRIQDLAYMIVFDLSKKRPEAKTWTGLKYFTESLEAYSRYTKNHQLRDLQVASINCIKAKKAESDYQLLYGIFYNLGIAYFNLNNFECSKEMFKHSTDLKKDDEKAFIGLGSSLSCLYLYEDAMKAFDKALEISPNNSDALILRGKTLFLLHKYEDALDNYNKVLDADPYDSDAVYDRACVYCKKGKKKEALYDLKCAIDIDQKWKEFAKNDEDLKKLRENELFKKLIQ